jgi:hypothetical protein
MSAIKLSTPSSGSISLSPADTASNLTITVPAVSGTMITTASSGQVIPRAALPAGSVLQVVSTTKTDKFSSTQNDSVYVDVTGLSASITPISASSKILVMASVLTSTTNATYYSLMGVRFARGGTAIGTGTSNFSSGIASVVASDTTSAYASVPLVFLDSPSSTSSLTYSVQIAQRIGGSQVIQVNADRGGGQIGSSTITVMEIAA